MTQNLNTEVKRLLEARRGEWPAVSQSTGVSYSWICKFMAGKQTNPRYKTLVTLQKKLTKQAAAREASRKPPEAPPAPATPESAQMD